MLSDLSLHMGLSVTAFLSMQVVHSGHLSGTMYLLCSAFMGYLTLQLLL